jgi:hypothetical protein
MTGRAALDWLCMCLAFACLGYLLSTALIMLQVPYMGRVLILTVVGVVLAALLLRTNWTTP